MKKQLYIEWEAATLSITETLWYQLFPRLFIRRMNRKWKRYEFFVKKCNDEGLTLSPETKSQ